MYYAILHAVTAPSTMDTAANGTDEDPTSCMELTETTISNCFTKADFRDSHLSFLLYQHSSMDKYVWVDGYTDGAKRQSWVATQRPVDTVK